MRIDDICLSTNSAALTALLQGKYSMARSLFCRNLVITPNVLTLNNYAAFLLENLCGSQYLHPLRELAALAMLHLAYSFKKDTLPGLNLATVYQKRIEYGLSHSYSKVASVYKRLLKDCQDSSIVYNLAVAEYQCGYFTDAAHHFLESLRYNRDRIYEEGGNPVLALYEMKYCGFSDIMPSDDDLYFASAVCDEEERYRLAFFSGQYEKVIHQAPNLFAVWEPSLQHLAMLCESYLKIFDGEIILSGDSLSFLAEDALRILSDFKENNASRRAALIQNECSLPFLSFCQYYGCTEHIESYNRCEVLLTNH